jgi:hypothetical protein
MRNVIALLTILSLSGCAVNMGKTTTDECKGVYVSVGDTTGPCGMKGGIISVPGAGLVGGVFKYVSDAVLGFFGSPPVVIQHNDSQSEPALPEPETTGD